MTNKYIIILLTQPLAFKLQSFSQFTTEQSWLKLMRLWHQIYLIGSLFIHIQLAVVLGQAVSNFLNGDCDYYLAPSKFVPSGRGVIAGRPYEEGDNILKSISIEIPNFFVRKTQLSNYVFGASQNDTSLVILGINMMINHHDNPNTENVYASTEMFDVLADDVTQPYRHFNVKIDSIDRPATRIIGHGDELFGSYGPNNSWFTGRGLYFVPTDYDPKKHRYSSLLLKANGVCYSNVYNEKSLISTPSPIELEEDAAAVNEHDDVVEEEFDYFGDFVQTRLDAATRRKHFSTPCVSEILQPKLEPWDGEAGQGLFSKVMVKSGDLVTVSPVLILPLHSIIAGSDANATLINHCLISASSLNRQNTNYSDVCLFPFGPSALMNHAPVTGRPSLCAHGTRNVTANVAIEWFAFNNYSAADACALSAAVTGADPVLYCDLPEGADYFESNRNKSAHLNHLLSSNTTLQQLEQFSHSPLDIGYRAIRDIAPGDEIYVDYGREWEVAFSLYLQRMEEYYEHMDRLRASEPAVKVVEPLPPQFRHPMIFPDELFPSHWKGVGCLGYRCADEDEDSNDESDYYFDE